MNRRHALAFLIGAIAFAAAAQDKVHRIGYVENTISTPEGIALRDAFRQGLRERGWIEGKNILVEYRWAEGKFERLPAIMAELVGLKVELIFVRSSIYVEAARKATQTIPIVFAVHAEPVGTGHVASLRRPGGNITGLSLMQTELNAKGLELLKEAVPGLSRIAALWNPATPSNVPGIKSLEASASALGLKVQALAIRSPEELEKAFAAMQKERAEALLVIAAPIFFAAQRPLADLAIKHRLPTMFGASEHAEVGGLLSYAASYPDLFRRAAGYVDRILKGAKPGDLPVEQPTRFELVANARTASALGIRLPRSILGRADRVIE